LITAIGNPVYDYIKTYKVEPDGRVLSGCSTNAVLALSKMGEDVRLVGAVGDDYKTQFIADLAKHGIEHVITPSNETGVHESSILTLKNPARCSIFIDILR